MNAFRNTIYRFSERKIELVTIRIVWVVHITKRILTVDETGITIIISFGLGTQVAWTVRRLRCIKVHSPSLQYWDSRIETKPPPSPLRERLPCPLQTRVSHQCAIESTSLEEDGPHSENRILSRKLNNSKSPTEHLLDSDSEMDSLEYCKAAHEFQLKELLTFRKRLLVPTTEPVRVLERRAAWNT